MVSLKNKIFAGFLLITTTFLTGFITSNVHNRDLLAVKDRELLVYKTREIELLNYKKYFEQLMEDPRMRTVLESSWSDDETQSRYFVLLFKCGALPKDIVAHVCELNKLRESNGIDKSNI